MDFYPKIFSFAELLEKSVFALCQREKDKRPDLYALALSYTGVLRSKKGDLIQDSAFCKIELKKQSKVLKNSNTIQTNSNIINKKGSLFQNIPSNEESNSTIDITITPQITASHISANSRQKVKISQVSGDLSNDSHNILNKEKRKINASFSNGESDNILIENKRVKLHQMNSNVNEEAAIEMRRVKFAELNTSINNETIDKIKVNTNINVNINSNINSNVNSNDETLEKVKTILSQQNLSKTEKTLNETIIETRRTKFNQKLSSSSENVDENLKNHKVKTNNDENRKTRQNQNDDIKEKELKRNKINDDEISKSNLINERRTRFQKSPLEKSPNSQISNTTHYGKLK